MTVEQQPVTAPVSGLYEVTVTATPPGGQPQTLLAVYRGNPLRDPDAELVYGEDIVREGAKFYGNSGRTIDTSGPALAVTFGTAPA